MRLAETVARETFDHVPDQRHRFGVFPARRGPGEEIALVIFEFAPTAFFRKHLAQAVGFGRIETGDRHPGLGHVFLIHHDAEGLGELLFQPRVQRLPAAALESADVFVDVLVGRRANDRAVYHQAFVAAGAALFLQLPHGGRLDIKHTQRFAPRDQLLRARIVDGVERRVGNRHAFALLDRAQRVADHRQAAVAE